METPQSPRETFDGYPLLLKPERLERALTRVVAIHKCLRQRGNDPARLPNPVEELVKARDRGSWE